MLLTEIQRVIEQVSRDKGIEREILIKALEEAVGSAVRKKFGSNMDVEIEYNQELGEFEIFQFKEVVEELVNPGFEIILSEGQKLDPGCEIGDSLGVKLEVASFGRIAAQSAKQVIIQKLKDAERNAVYVDFKDRKGEVLNGIVQRIDRGNIIVNLGNTEGILRPKEQIPRELNRRGDRIRSLIKDVLQDTRGPQIILTRTDPDFLTKLFKVEVPEIGDGIVEIKGAAREPGSRAKFAVASNDSDIDPVGACVGMKGSRVQNVVQELKGEKIDIISWHVDPAKYVCNALSPAEISRVIIDEENRSMEVIVPDEFLSVAIGKRGQNVRLASKLTGWRLDVISETNYSEAMQDSYDSLMQLEGVGISMADTLYEKGFYSAEILAEAAIDDLIQVRGIGEEKANQLIENAKKYVLEIKNAQQKEPALTDTESTDEISDMENVKDFVAEPQPDDVDIADTEDDTEAAGAENADDVVSENTAAKDDDVAADEKDATTQRSADSDNGNIGDPKITETIIK